MVSEWLNLKTIHTQDEITDICRLLEYRQFIQKKEIQFLQIFFHEVPNTPEVFGKLLPTSCRSHYGPVVDSAANSNEYQEYFLGVKAAGA